MQKGPAYCGNIPALGSGSGLQKVPEQATEAGQSAVSAHRLCFHSCLQVPTLSSLEPCLPRWWRGRMREGGRCCSSLGSLLTKWGWDWGVVAQRMPWRARCTWVRFSLLSVPATVRLPSSCSVFRLWILWGL